MPTIIDKTDPTDVARGRLEQIRRIHSMTHVNFLTWPALPRRRVLDNGDELVVLLPPGSELDDVPPFPEHSLTIQVRNLHRGTWTWVDIWESKPGDEPEPP